ncbi:fumarate reductase (quinol) flavoprotein subunit [Moritella sp. 24]|uniref:fumarate reductase (quinol) flavoprotein subunit n=1 Tax=Moritella sp. 24 TaxID=2746230 RepID=UPI001BA905FC|nr:fumarate reductase (quinol) flavoprotein subunit [Moritella sp. 24]QUM75886.1 fumarate reductase (quinol) flavoprotein subunit [Moritella sp. 24]
MQKLKIIQTDVAIIGAGGSGLRAAIEIAENHPELDIALISKVYPMRSHTVAAEGGAAGVAQDHDSLDNHFNDTVSGGDWLCEQDVVEYFVENAAKQLTQLEHWGCPWSRKEDGSINVRAFGGMKIERTWFAADKSGFHILHTLFQTSVQHPKITRFDEHFCLDLIIEDDKIQGVVILDIAEGEVKLIQAKSVIMATGGAGRVYSYNTNGGIVTGDGMSLAYRHGIALRDMEFVQYHPTGLPGSGILMTEGCRGEGGILVNKDGYRYLQDYGLGPEVPVGQTKNKYMELGPRDKLSQCFWQEQQKGRVFQGERGDYIHLDLRHLGEAKINERLPFIRELAKAYVGVDPVHEPIPVRPTVHYTMGGIATDAKTATSLAGLYAIGECASVGLHGANRLGSNSLTELAVFGQLAGQEAANYASNNQHKDIAPLKAQAEAVIKRMNDLLHSDGSEKPADIRQEMGDCMEEGVGIYRTQESMQKTIDKLAELKVRYKDIKIEDKSSVFNTDFLYTIELGYLLDTAEAMAHSAILREESRGSHQRIDGFEARDDVKFLKHSLAYYQADKAPKIDYSDVKITKSQPAVRAYGAAGEKAAQENK